ncbi:MAG: hypothetical protein AB7C97_10810 [Oscillospiraceae bacterium]
MDAERKRGRIKIAAIVILIIVLILASVFIIKALNTPERVAEKFLSAMSKADFDELSKVAVLGSENAEFTADSVQPMFELYADSTIFRDSVKAAISSDIDGINNRNEPDSGNVFDLSLEKGTLFKKYNVVITPCRVIITTNYAGATVFLGDKSAISEKSSEAAAPQNSVGNYSEDYENFCSAEVSFSDILPGRYSASVNFSTKLGDTFSRVRKIDVSSVNMAADMTVTGCYTMTVYNYSNYRITVSAGKGQYSLPSNEELLIGPIAGDRKVVAGYEPSDGEGLEIEETPADNDYLCFELCELYVLNYNKIPLKINVDGEFFGNADVNSSVRVFPLSYNAVVSMVAEGCDFLAPYEYTVEYNYDSVYPTFSISDNALTEIKNYLTEEVSRCIDAFNAKDSNEVKKYASFEFGAQFYDILTGEKSDGEMTYTLENLNCYGSDNWYIGDDNISVVGVDFDCDMKVKTEKSGDYDTSGHFTVFVRYLDGNWELFAVND